MDSAWLRVLRAHPLLITRDGLPRPQAFEAEMQSFFILFNRYLAERAKGQKMCVPSKASTPVASFDCKRQGEGTYC